MIRTATPSERSSVHAPRTSHCAAGLADGIPAGRGHRPHGSGGGAEPHGASRLSLTKYNASPSSPAASPLANRSGRYVPFERRTHTGGAEPHGAGVRGAGEGRRGPLLPAGSLEGDGTGRVDAAALRWRSGADHAVQCRPPAQQHSGSRQQHGSAVAEAVDAVLQGGELQILRLTPSLQHALIGDSLRSRGWRRR